MKAVIRQQIKARFKVFLGNLVLISLVSLSISLTGKGSNIFELGDTTMLGFWLQLAFSATYFGIPIYCVVSFIKLLKSMVFQDTKYLLMSLPRSSYTIFGGTYLTILIEFLLYAILLFFWFTITASSVQTHGNFFISEPMLSNSFWYNLKNIYYYFFVKHLARVLQGFVLIIIYGSFVAMVFSFSFTLFAALFKHKKFPKILTIVGIYLIFDLTVRILGGFSNRLHLKGSAALWVPASITAVLAIGFFVGTSWLFEKKIEA